MVKNNKIFTIAAIIILISSCNNGYKSYLENANNTLIEQKKSFAEDYNKQNLLIHFPKKIINDSFRLYCYPPSCPPSYNCSSQTGEVYLICKKNDYYNRVSKILSDSALCVYNYFDNGNMIIDLMELKRTFIPIEKCNKFYKDKYPIPYFEKIDFGLGLKRRKDTVINKQRYFTSTYFIPTDLEIYVISAQAGNYWKVDCKEKRPESLKNWINGYSRGIAISNKENLLIYWVMVW